MASLLERMRNVFTDDQERHYDQELAKIDRSERALGRIDIGELITKKLVEMETNIRSDWATALVASPEDSETINSHFEGQVMAYNSLAIYVHDLENASQINIEQLPQILDQSSVQRGVLAEVDSRERIAGYQATLDFLDHSFQPSKSQNPEVLQQIDAVFLAKTISETQEQIRMERIPVSVERDTVSGAFHQGAQDALNEWAAVQKEHLSSALKGLKETTSSIQNEYAADNLVARIYEYNRGFEVQEQQPSMEMGL